MNRMSPSLRTLKGSCQLSIKHEAVTTGNVTYIQLVLPSAKALKRHNPRFSIFASAETITVILTLVHNNDGEEQHGALERVEQHPDKAGCQKKLFLNNSSDMTHNRGLPMIHPKITEKGMTKSLQMTPQISHVSQMHKLPTLKRTQSGWTTRRRPRWTDRACPCRLP